MVASPPCPGSSVKPITRQAVIGLVSRPSRVAMISQFYIVARLPESWAGRTRVSPPVSVPQSFLPQYSPLSCHSPYQNIPLIPNPLPSFPSPLVIPAQTGIQTPVDRSNRRRFAQTEHLLTVNCLLFFLIATSLQTPNFPNAHAKPPNIDAFYCRLCSTLQVSRDSNRMQLSRKRNITLPVGP